MQKKSKNSTAAQQKKTAKSNVGNKTTKISKKQLRTRLFQRLESVRQKKNLIRRKKTSLHQQFLQTLRVEDLTCSICMELYLMPFSLPCGHIFCFQCLDTLSQHHTVCNICPCCRAQIGENYPARSRVIENILPHIVDSKLTEEDKENYKLRNAKMLKTFEQRSLENKAVKINQKVDIKIGNHWEVGTVKKIYQKESKTKIEVQAQHSNIIYVFTNSSTHLASHGTFTREPIWDIEDFLNLDLFSLPELPEDIQEVDVRVIFSHNRRSPRIDFMPSSSIGSRIPSSSSLTQSLGNLEDRTAFPFEIIDLVSQSGPEQNEVV